MSAYDYYRANYQGWGSTQLSFKTPPPPSFQPRSTWSGWDYYRAQAVNPDHNLYYSIMNRVGGLGASSSGGPGQTEARSWHRRVYSGLVSLAHILPADIGAAGAYEAYRMWKYHYTPLFETLGGVPEREREALIGMAIGEASRLWQYSGRPMDTYGLRDCLESAAMIASRIAFNVIDRLSTGMGSGMGSSYERDYGSTRHRRLSSVSTASRPIVIQQPGGSPYLGGASSAYGGGSGFGGAGMPIPAGGGSPYAGGMGLGGGSHYGTGGSPYGGGGIPIAGSGAGHSPYGGGGGLPGSYGNNGGGIAGSYGNTGGGLPGYTSSGGGYPGGGGGGYAGSHGGAQMMGSTQPWQAPGSGMQGRTSPYMGGGGIGQSGYAGSGYAEPSRGYGGASAYGQSQPYGGGGASIIANGQTIPAPPGSTIIIKGRSRRSSSSGYRHHRSRSQEPMRTPMVYRA